MDDDTKRKRQTHIVMPPSIRWSDARSDMVREWAEMAAKEFRRTIHHVDVVPDKTDEREPFIIKIVFDLRDR